MQQLHSAISVGVGAVDEALDWCWLFDFGQGDISRARVAAEAALADGRTAGALMARAVVHMVQGEQTAALPLLGRAYELEPEADRRRLVAAVAYRCEREHRFLVPDGTHQEFLETRARWGELRVGKGEWLARASVADGETPLAIVAELTAGLIATLPETRTVVSDYAAELGRVEFGPLTIGLESLPRALEAEIPGSAVFAAGTLQQLRALSGDVAGALSGLEAAAESQREAGDAPGFVWLTMLAGDALVAQHGRGSPVIFGQRINDLSGEDIRTSPAHEVVPSSDEGLTRAEELYARARAEAGRYVDSRASAQLDLRQAFFSCLRAEPTAVQCFADCARRFLALGDLRAARGARCARLWAANRSGAPAADLMAGVRPLASELAASDAMTEAISWGTALFQAGTAAVVARGDVDEALRAADVAEEIFSASGLHLRRAKAAADCAAAVLTVDALDAARVAVSAALEACRADESAAATMIARRETIERHLLGLALQLEQQGQDAEALEATARRARELLERTGAPSEELVMRAARASGAAVVVARDLVMRPTVVQDDVAKLAEHEREAQAGASVLAAALRAAELDHTATLASLCAELERGTQARDVGWTGEADRRFARAMRLADGLRDREFHRAVILTRWEKWAEAAAALHAYEDAGLPHGTRVQELVDVALGRESPTTSAGQHSHVASAYANIEHWKDARRSYALDGISLDAPSERLERLDLADLANLARIAAALEMHPRAIELFGIAGATVELRRSDLRWEEFRRTLGARPDVRALYADWARTASAVGRPEIGFEVAERARARALTEGIATNAQVERLLGDTSQYRRLKGLAARLERLTSLLSQAGDSDRALEMSVERRKCYETFSELERELVEQHPALGGVAGLSSAVTMADVAAQLRADEVLVAYELGFAALLMWVIRREGLVQHEQVRHWRDRDLRAYRVRRSLRAAVSALGTAAGAAELDILSEILIAPVFDNVRSARRMFVVPFVELSVFPFVLLRGDGRSIGEAIACTVLPSAAVLPMRSRPTSSASRALVIGDPVSMSLKTADDERRPLRPLPGARLEALAAAEEHDVPALVGARATRGALVSGLRARPRIVHLATHGLLGAGSALDARLALAHGQAIRADELIGLDLIADAVILSGCDTGRGAPQGGEIVGLARSLLLAGARATVISLWRVSDAATTILMAVFHRLLAQGASVAGALQGAQSTVRQMTADAALRLVDEIASSSESRGVPSAMLLAALPALRGEILELSGDHRAALIEYRRALRHTRSAWLRAQADTAAQRVSESRSHEPSERPFEHPRRWAGFVVYGVGGA